MKKPIISRKMKIQSLTDQQRYTAIAEIIGAAFGQMQAVGFDVMEINAVALGMVRKSMEANVGREQAIQHDDTARKAIGWAE